MWGGLLRPEFSSLRATAVYTRACISGLLQTLTSLALGLPGVTWAVTPTGFQGFLLFLNFPSHRVNKSTGVLHTCSPYSVLLSSSMKCITIKFVQLVFYKWRCWGTARPLLRSDTCAIWLDEAKCLILLASVLLNHTPLLPAKGTSLNSSFTDHLYACVSFPLPFAGLTRPPVRAFHWCLFYPHCTPARWWVSCAFESLGVGRKETHRKKNSLWLLLWKKLKRVILSLKLLRTSKWFWLSNRNENSFHRHIKWFVREKTHK